MDVYQYNTVNTTKQEMLYFSNGYYSMEACVNVFFQYFKSICWHIWHLTVFSIAFIFFETQHMVRFLKRLWEAYDILTNLHISRIVLWAVPNARSLQGRWWQVYEGHCILIYSVAFEFVAYLPFHDCSIDLNSINWNRKAIQT